MAGPATQRAPRQSAADRYLMALAIATTGIFLWSAIRPKDDFTWLLEVLPAALGAFALAATYSRFRLTNFLYTLIAVHMMVLMVGGHYTYAEVPLFNWIRDHFHEARNNYDRVGHFMQGFTPALLCREVFVRRRIVKRGPWMLFIIILVCMGFSALYELFEWRVAVATGSAADAFLGTQGDTWDTQEDMAICLVGAVTALALFSRVHDRALAPVMPEGS